MLNYQRVSLFPIFPHVTSSPFQPHLRGAKDGPGPPMGGPGGPGGGRVGGAAGGGGSVWRQREMLRM